MKMQDRVKLQLEQKGELVYYSFTKRRNTNTKRDYYLVKYCYTGEAMQYKTIEQRRKK